MKPITITILEYYVSFKIRIGAQCGASTQFPKVLHLPFMIKKPKNHGTIQEFDSYF